MYYYLRRDTPEEWKCQPKHWLSAELERHEIVVGAFSLTIGSFISACMACWVVNDGWSTIYYNVAEYGYLWFILQFPAIFILQVSLDSHLTLNRRGHSFKDLKSFISNRQFSFKSQGTAVF